MALIVQSAAAQRLNFITSTPILDSFPVVRFHMTASYNGSLPVPAVQSSDITMNEDGTAVTPMLDDCDDSQLSAVVFCVDVSTSMESSVGDGFDISQKFFDCFGPAITELRGTSRYALVTFTDSVVGVYPGPTHPSGFYFAGNAADSQAFVGAIHNQPYFGGTYVDAAVFKAVSMLQYAPFQQRAVVLVTDDATLDYFQLDSLMQLYHITFYVMEVGSDNSPHNVTLSHMTGGVYFQAQDSLDFSPVMSQLGELISSEHCTLRYRSPNPCPWYANHTVNMALTYSGLTRTSTEYYTLGEDVFDTEAPDISIASPTYTSRIVTASENFPCQRGLKLAFDSVVENFILLNRAQTFTHYFPKIGGVYRDSSYIEMRDSLIVADSMSTGRLIYIAYDSAGNRSGKEFLYAPKPDVLAPVVTVAQSSAGKYSLSATEIRPWDRGLVSISLQAGATNIVLDSAKLFSKRIGNAWVHIVDMKQPAHGCIEAVDSAGNTGDYCIDHTDGQQDTLPPVIKQDAVVSPIKNITGTVTELRPLDRGIMSIVIQPYPTLGTPTYAYASKAQATFSVQILDSLQPVRTLITASDSLGNASLDTLRYDPLPDENAPVCSVDVVSPTERLFKATELAPWDRGIAAITVVGVPTNMTAGPVTFTSRYEAQELFTVIDPTQTASVVVQASDSSGHQCVSTISVSPTVIPLVPFSTSGNVDFLTHLAPFDSTADIVITNPNEVPVIVTTIVQGGETTAITSDATKPMIFQGLEAKTIHVRLNTSLIGTWASDFTLSNDSIQLAHVTTTGTTTGLVQVSVDTARPLHSQLPDTLHISVAATPNPINLDSLSFDLNFDGDLIQQYAPLVDCSKANAFCNYNVQMTNPTRGVLHFLLSRNDRSMLSALISDSARIGLPFIPFVTKNNSSAVNVVNLSSPLTSLSSDPGLVSIGDECGDPAIRAMMNDQLSAYVKSVVPNPASRQADVTVVSASGDNSIVITLVDALGASLRRLPVTVAKGETVVSVPVSDLPSGNYMVVLSVNGNQQSSVPLVILR